MYAPDLGLPTPEELEAGGTFTTQRSAPQQPQQPAPAVNFSPALLATLGVLAFVLLKR